MMVHGAIRHRRFSPGHDRLLKQQDGRDGRGRDGPAGADGRDARGHQGAALCGGQVGVCGALGTRWGGDSNAADAAGAAAAWST